MRAGDGVAARLRVVVLGVCLLLLVAFVGGGGVVVACDTRWRAAECCSFSPVLWSSVLVRDAAPSTLWVFVAAISLPVDGGVGELVSEL